MTTDMSQDPSTRPPAERRRSSLRWAERILLLIGLLCLGSYAYALLDSHLYEYWENRRLEETLAGRAAQPPSSEVPAQESRALADFHEKGAEREERARDIPAPEEGELIGRIEIPEIGVSAIVQEGVASRILRRGAGRIPGTALPWEPGNVGIAAHRDSFFRGLKDISKNDTIVLTTVNGTYRYRVDWTQVVKPKDTDVLHDTGEDALTLVTCYPFYYVGSAPKRFIVRAHRLEDGEAG
jgi:sortase A